MRLIVVGLNHRTAPVELRERLDFPRAALPAAIDALAARHGPGEVAILSTCNRVELYAASADPARSHERLAGFLADYHRMDGAGLAPHLYAFRDAEAARHLFRVAAGLDSLVVGEPQILGQVKDAYTAAAGRRATGPVLHRLFHASFAVGKRVRSETAVGEGAVSVSYAALALARKIFGRLEGLHVLILGAGEMAKLTARHLRGQRAASVTVTSRTFETAAALAAQVGGGALPWAELPRALEQADVVVAATGAAEPVLTRARLQAAMRARRNRPLFIVDIAVPRDVEPEAGELEQVFLYDIDDLQAIVSENLARRAGELERAERIVDEAVARFQAWLRSRATVPTVVALRHRFEAVRRAELRRLEPKLAGLSPEARARVEEITRLLVEKLLATPTERLKSLAADERTASACAEAVARVFDLEAAARVGDADEMAAEATLPAASAGAAARTRRADPAEGT
jgi:glutamyl-tRNA reductase